MTAASADDVYDVAIVGAGAAGAAAAVLLARAGLRVALVTKNGVRSERPAEVCSPATLRLLRAVGLPLPDAVQHARVCRGVLSAWDTPRPQFFDYGLFACEPALAIDRSAFDAALLTAARSAGADIVTHRGSITVARPAMNWIVGCGRTHLRAAWFVDASGRSGGVAPLMTSRRCFGDRLVACAMRQPRCDASSTYDDLLLLAAVRGGWWYVTQSAGADVSIVYLTDADLLPRTAAARNAHLMRAFEEAHLLHECLAAVPAFSTHRLADARSSHRLEVAGNGWIAIGDAALSVDPLSGEGLRLAIASAAAACDALVSARVGQSPSEPFARWYDDQRAEQRRAATAAYAPVARRFANDVFWRRREPSAVRELSGRM